MTEKELRKLSRTELLEMLLEQTRRVEELERQLASAQAALNDRRLALNQAGSIAEAALKLNGVFEAAQQACAQYTENIQALSERQAAVCAQMEAESYARARQTVEAAERQREKIERTAKQTADAMVQQAQTASQQYWNDVSAKLENFYQQHAGLRELLAAGLPGRK